MTTPGRFRSMSQVDLVPLLAKGSLGTWTRGPLWKLWTWKLYFIVIVAEYIFFFFWFLDHLGLLLWTNLFKTLSNFSIIVILVFLVKVLSILRISLLYLIFLYAFWFWFYFWHSSINTFCIKLSTLWYPPHQYCSYLPQLLCSENQR